jgi:orotate phosphoribosyltransferase
VSDTASGQGPHAALVAHLLEHSVRRGDFVLKSGARSDWFIDSKQTACDPAGILLVAEAALSVIPDSATAIGGLTVGADPVAYGVAAVAATRGRSLRSFTIRKEAKDHGVTGRLAGPLREGDRVVVTEDTVTRGTSLFEAVEVVHALGADHAARRPWRDVRGHGGPGRHPVPTTGDGSRARLLLRRGLSPPRVPGSGRRPSRR